MVRILITVLSLFFLFTFGFARDSTDWRNFFPHHVGDVWQYRSLYTGELIQTLFLDSLYTDSSSLDTYIFFHNVYRGGATSSVGRLNTSGNYYDYAGQLWYKFNADSGERWIVRNADSVRIDTVIGTVSNIYQAYVFGVYTNVKVFRYTIHFPSQNPFWIGTDHFAEGFGLVRIDIEPSDSYVLTGAIIDSVRYGVIVSVKGESYSPQEFDVIENYPNPFNNVTVISYRISSDSYVNITIYDVVGRIVGTLIDERKQRGSYKFYFKGDHLTSGTYFAVMKTNSSILIHKILFIK